MGIKWPGHCELVFKPKADILNIHCDYQFVFSVRDKLSFHIMLDAAGISKSALQKYQMQCFQFLLGSISTIFR